MRNKISALISASVLVMTLTPMLALAQPQSSCNLKHDQNGFDSACLMSNNPIDVDVTPKWGMCCVLDAIETVTDWVFFFLVTVVAFLVIWGGFSIATAGGDEGKFKQGRDYILFAMIGLAVALLSKAIPAVVMALIG
jgi:hypothetical protein